jgi:hypothetical protein
MDEPKASPEEVAALGAVIERAAANLALAEEPSCFLAALDQEGSPEEGPRHA